MELRFILFFLNFAHRIRLYQMTMEINTVYYKNKIHDFHSWGGAVLI